MQTTIQFSSPSTFQEWSNFKLKLNNLKADQKPLLNKKSDVDVLLSHLTEQLRREEVFNS